MKKRLFLNFWLLLTVGMATVVFNSCGKDKEETDANQNNSNGSHTSGDGVIINGVKWATRNVAAPGTFAASPKDFGMFYQWNRKTGWSSADPMVNSNGGTVWDATTPAGSVWERVNDPSPSGWRVPTLNEINSLVDATKVRSEWITEGGVYGKKFTDKTSGNSIFLPAAGCRSSGTLSYTSTIGYYWSSMLYRSDGACFLFFDNNVAGWDTSRQYRSGYSVRSVAE